MSVDDEPPQVEKQEPVQDSELLKNLEAKVGDIANRWLKERFGVREEADGFLHFPETERVKELAVKAEQFMRGFFRGFMERPELAAASAAAPQVTEVMGKLLTRTTQTVTDAFQDYVRENAVDEAHPTGPVVLDGRFVMRHGGPLIGRIVQALGGAFSSDGRSEAHAHDGPPVEVKVELPDVFKTLLSGRIAGDDKAPAGPAGASDPSDEDAT
ncbi:MAG: hypothetical protein U1F43_30010 [Myxococcota bacterium]